MSNIGRAENTEPGDNGNKGNALKTTNGCFYKYFLLRFNQFGWFGLLTVVNLTLTVSLADFGVTNQNKNVFVQNEKNHFS